MRKKLVTNIVATALVLVSTSVCAGPLVGDVTIDFTDWSGPPIPVRLFVPEAVDSDAPIVIVLHGASRDAERYYEDWRSEAANHDFVVAVPYFSRDDFPKSAHYNLGYVFEPAPGAQRPPDVWTFAVIEPLFDAVVEMLDGRQTRYTLFGHSAGSQFLHRFLYYVPGARVKRAIAANAGWYTMPEFGVRYPYGLAESDYRGTRFAVRKDGRGRRN